MADAVQSTVEARIGIATQVFADDLTKACSQINKVLNDIQKFTPIPATADAAVALCEGYLELVNTFKDNADQKLRVLQYEITRATRELVTEKNNVAEKAKKLDVDQEVLDIERKNVQQYLTQISTIQEHIKNSNETIKKYDERMKKKNEAMKSVRESANARDQELDELKIRMNETDRKQGSTQERYNVIIDRMTALEEAMGRYNEGGQSSQSNIRILEDLVTRYERLTTPQAPTREEVIEHLQEQLAKAQQDIKELPAVRASLKEAQEKISMQQSLIQISQTQVQMLQEEYDNLQVEFGVCRTHSAVSDRNL